MNRIIEFECAEKVYSDLVGMCDVLQSNYGFAGEEFVSLLKEDGAIDFVRDLQRQYYHELLKHDSTEKQAAAASALLTADAIATEWIFKDGNELTVNELIQFISTKKEVDVNARAYDYILELCARNPQHFKSSESFNVYPGEVWGKHENDCVYIIKSVFDREMSMQGFNSVSFLSWAKRKGLARCDDRRCTKKARINGTPVNCACIVKKDDESRFVEFDENVFENL